MLSDSPRPFGNRMQKDRTPHVEFKVLGKEKSYNSDQKERFLKATGFGLWEKYRKLIIEEKNKKADIIFTLDYPHKKSSKRPFPHLMVLDIRQSKQTHKKGA